MTTSADFEWNIFMTGSNQAGVGGYSGQLQENKMRTFRNRCATGPQLTAIKYYPQTPSLIFNGKGGMLAFWAQFQRKSHIRVWPMT